MRILLILFRFVLLPVGGVLMAAAGTSPEETVSNLAAWASKSGIDKVPDFLATQGADQWGMWIGAVLVSLGILSFFIKRKNKMPIPVRQKADLPQAKPNPFDLLADECKAADATHTKLTRKPGMFIMHWVYYLNRLRNERNTHNIENLFNLIGPGVLAVPGNGNMRVSWDEILFTLRCLELRGYIALKKTSDTLIGGDGGHYNEEIKFSAKYDEFISQVRFVEKSDGYSVYW